MEDTPQANDLLHPKQVSSTVTYLTIVFGLKKVVCSLQNYGTFRLLWTNDVSLLSII